jgi:hypothetical protein
MTAKTDEVARQAIKKEQITFFGEHASFGAGQGKEVEELTSPKRPDPCN